MISQIRCPPAHTDTCDKVEAKNVAHLSSMRKSTIHSMLGGLMDNIHKKPNGNVHLNNDGRVLARKP